MKREHGEYFWQYMAHKMGRLYGEGVYVLQVDNTYGYLSLVAQRKERQLAKL